MRVQNSPLRKQAKPKPMSESDHAVRLIVGLGNPGPQYSGNRHNVGAWFIERLARASGGSTFSQEMKFKAFTAKVSLAGVPCWIMIPTTYMNESGRAVAAVAHFYKIAPSDVLIAHDELDFEVGKVRLKREGGHGGHNGLRDIIRCLGTDSFLRLRIGIGHPGHRDRVSAYVLSDPPAADKDNIEKSLDDGLQVIPDLVTGDIEKAFRALHSDLRI